MDTFEVFENSPPGCNGHHSDLWAGAQFDMDSAQFDTGGAQFDMDSAEFDTGGPQFCMDSAQFGTEGPQFCMDSAQFGTEGPRFDIDSAQFGTEGPQFDTGGAQFGTEGPRFDIDSAQFGTEGPQFDTGGAQFGTEGPRFDIDSAQFGTEGPRFDIDSAQFGTEGPRFDIDSAQFGTEGPQFDIDSAQFGTEGPQFCMDSAQFGTEGPRFDIDSAQFGTEGYTHRDVSDSNLTKCGLDEQLEGDTQQFFFGDFQFLQPVNDSGLSMTALISQRFLDVQESFVSKVLDRKSLETTQSKQGVKARQAQPTKTQESSVDGTPPVCVICLEPAGGADGALLTGGCGCNLLAHKGCLAELARHKSTDPECMLPLKQIYSQCHACKRKVSGQAMLELGVQCYKDHKARQFGTPAKRQAVIVYCRALQEHGLHSKALPHLRKLTQRYQQSKDLCGYNEHLRALRRLALAQFHAGRRDEAEKTLRKAFVFVKGRNNWHICPKGAIVEACLGLCLSRSGKVDQGSRHLRSAMDRLTSKKMDKLRARFS